LIWVVVWVVVWVAVEILLSGLRGGVRGFWKIRIVVEESSGRREAAGEDEALAERSRIR